MGRFLLALVFLITWASSAAADLPRDDGAERSRDRRMTFIAAVVGATMLVGGLAVLARRRRRKSPLSASAELGAAASRSAEDRGFSKICPACGRKYESEALLCPDDRERLVLLN